MSGVGTGILRQYIDAIVAGGGAFLSLRIV